MMDRVLCSISTKGRYHSTLPLAIQSVISQTKKVDKLVIFDDNDNPVDLRDDAVYKSLFNLMDYKGIAWEWVFAKRKGQHYNHQLANEMGYEWVWRVDDDNIAEPTVLETLYSYIGPKIGAIGGQVLTLPLKYENMHYTGKIENINSEAHIQAQTIKEVKEVDHLHCSFLYKAGVHDYNLNLSQVAHREETLFTYGLKQKGYTLLTVPGGITWHLKNPTGGIRCDTSPVAEKLFIHDDIIFKNIVNFKEQTIVVLDCGMGDHVVFKHVLPEINNPVIFSCYPDIVPGRSIGEAKALFGNLDAYSIYIKMNQWNWKDSVENAFRKLYVRPK